MYATYSFICYLEYIKGLQLVQKLGGKVFVGFLVFVFHIDITIQFSPIPC